MCRHRLLLVGTGGTYGWWTGGKEIMRLMNIFFLRTTAAAMLLIGFYLGGIFSIPE